jgi:hypothetical protein
MAGRKIFYIDIRIMLRSQYSVFYDYFKEFRELLIEGLFFGKNFKQNGEGANGSLPFFVCNFLPSSHSQCDNSRGMNNG